MSRPGSMALGLAWKRVGLFAGAAMLLSALAFFAHRLWLLDDGPDLANRLLLDQAEESGLTWRMRFLPNEQGETFKINLYDHGCGLAVADYDGDGHDDLYLVNQLGPNALYRNRGDGTFADATAAAGVALGDRVCVGACFADYDGDGRPDLYVTSTRGGNALFRNLGGGKFQDATREAGLEHVGHSQAATFFDFDNDGHLDLLVTNTAGWTLRERDPTGRYFPGKGAGGNLNSLIQSPKEDNRLYRNNGNGTFTDVTARSGLGGRGWSGDVALIDYDDDGYLDVLVTCMFGPTQLFHNDHNGKFTNVTAAVLGRTSWGGVGATTFSSRNDGRLDLLVLDMHSDMWMGVDYDHSSLPAARKAAGLKFASPDGPSQADLTEREWELALGCRRDEVLFGNSFFKNLGKGRFEERSDRAGLETFWPWGAAAGDFDNDGHEDLFITAGMGYPFYYWPNSLMVNNGDGTFTDRARELGVEPPVEGPAFKETIAGRKAVRSSRCAATGDFDGDGRLDIVVNNFNDRPYYFRNRSPVRNYVKFRLRGTRSNREAVGAIVRLHVGGEVLTRQVQSTSGYLAQSSKVLHFGLGGRASIDRVEITWPGGRRQTIDAPAINRLHEVTEGPSHEGPGGA